MSNHEIHGTHEMDEDQILFFITKKTCKIYSLMLLCEVAELLRYEARDFRVFSVFRG